MLNFLSLFAGPIGGLINRGLAIAAASAASWLMAKGVPASDSSVIVTGAITGLSTVISVFAKTQGVIIPVINASDNGVKVVKAGTDAPMVNGPLK